MKKTKNTLRIMISIASIFGFLGGWITFAHSLKPNQPVSDQALQPLPPLAPIEFGQSSDQQNNGGLTIISPSFQGRRATSMFMTGGS